MANDTRFDFAINRYRLLKEYLAIQSRVAWIGTREESIFLEIKLTVRGTLPNLNDKVGFGFSTNGDYSAFLENTKERVSPIRGPSQLRSTTQSNRSLDWGQPGDVPDARGSRHLTGASISRKARGSPHPFSW